jgi:hypothetical protein
MRRQGGGEWDRRRQIDQDLRRIEEYLDALALECESTFMAGSDMQHSRIWNHVMQTKEQLQALRWALAQEQPASLEVR